MKNSKTRFSNRVEDYIKYRPHYPFELITILEAKTGLNKYWVIADIGSGTGISSEPFLTNGNTVFGVEPNREMREAAERLFINAGDFKSIDGSAEATTLSDKSIDLIVAGQAFHWFEAAKTKTEFKRILKDGCYVALIWNERRSTDSPFLIGYENLLRKHCAEYEQVRHTNIHRETFDEFFGAGKYGLEILRNSQLLDWEGLKGRLLSSSYAPKEEEKGYLDMIHDLRQLFDRCKISDAVDLEYDTKLYYGKF